MRAGIADPAQGDDAHPVVCRFDFDLWARFFRETELFGVHAVLGGFRFQGQRQTAHRFEEYLAEAERILRAHGGRPYARGASSIRRAARWVPRRLRGPVHALGLGGEAPTIRRDPDGRWTIERVRFV